MMINYFDYNYSNTKGKTKAGDTFNSSLNMGPSDSNYTADLVKDHVVAFDGSATSAVLDWAPVNVDTFMITRVHSKPAVFLCGLHVLLYISGIGRANINNGPKCAKRPLLLLDAGQCLIRGWVIVTFAVFLAYTHIFQPPIRWEHLHLLSNGGFLPI